MSEVIVRNALLDDARAIAKVHTRTWQLAYDHVFPTDRLAGIVEERRAEQWHEIIREPEDRSHTLVATEVDKIVGFASCGPSRDPGADARTVGELYAVYVLPEAWGRGFGRALMGEVVERLRADGFHEAMLWVIEDNPRTRRYYEQAGWSFDGGLKDEAVLDIQVRQVRYRIQLDDG